MSQHSRSHSDTHHPFIPVWVAILEVKQVQYLDNEGLQVGSPVVAMCAPACDDVKLAGLEIALQFLQAYTTSRALSRSMKCKSNIACTHR